jgi:PAS domain S-box-containing protein
MLVDQHLRFISESGRRRALTIQVLSTPLYTFSQLIRDACGNCENNLMLSRMMKLSFEEYSELRESIVYIAENYFNQLFQNSLDAIFITDSEGNIQNANPQATKMTDLELEELRQCKLSNLIVSNQEGFVLISELPEKYELSQFEGILKTQHGNFLPVEIHAWRIH